MISKYFKLAKLLCINVIFISNTAYSNVNPKEMIVDLNNCTLGTNNVVNFSDMFVGERFNLSEIKKINDNKRNEPNWDYQNPSLNFSPRLKVIADELRGKIAANVSTLKIQHRVNREGVPLWFSDYIRFFNRGNTDNSQLALEFKLGEREFSIKGNVNKETTYKEFLELFKGRVFEVEDKKPDYEFIKYMPCNDILLEIKFTGYGYKKSLYKIYSVIVDLSNKPEKVISNLNNPIIELPQDVLKIQNSQHQKFIDLANDDDWLTGVWQYESDGGFQLYALFEKKGDEYDVRYYSPRYSVSWWTGRVVKNGEKILLWDYQIFNDKLQLAKEPSETGRYQQTKINLSKSSKYKKYHNNYEYLYPIDEPNLLAGLSNYEFISGENFVRSELERINRLKDEISEYDVISKSKQLDDGSRFGKLKVIASKINLNAKYYLTEVEVEREPQSGNCGSSTNRGFFWVYLNKVDNLWSIKDEVMLTTNDCGTPHLTSKLENIPDFGYLIYKVNTNTAELEKIDCYFVKSDSLEIEKQDCLVLSGKLSAHYNNQGLNEFKQKNYGVSSAYFKLSISQNPLNFDAQANLGLSLLKEGQYSESIEASKKLLSDDKIKTSLKANANFNIGIALEKRNEFKNALEFYQLSYNLLPTEAKKRTIEKLKEVLRQ